MFKMLFLIVVLVLGVSSAPQKVMILGRFVDIVPPPPGVIPCIEGNIPSRHGCHCCGDPTNMDRNCQLELDVFCSVENAKAHEQMIKAQLSVSKN